MSVSNNRDFPSVQLTPLQEMEIILDQEFALANAFKSVTPGLLRSITQDWVIDRLIADELIQRLHLEALRRISEALGHPLKGAGKTAIDLADLAVAAIKGKAGA